MTPTYKPMIGVVGASGSGKSTSLRNLNPATTHLIDLERKGFPFPHNFPYVHSVTNVGEFDTAVVAALSDRNCSTIVIESFTKYTELVLEMAQQSFKGYDIWNYYNRAIHKMFEKLKNKQATVVFTAIDEIVRLPQASGSENVQRRIKVSGKQHEGLVEKELVMVLFTSPQRDPKTNRTTYKFSVNTDGITSAKTPMGMYTEDEQLIDNDLNAVLKRWEEYHSKGIAKTVDGLK